ncbi:MAG: hypothetical protein M3N47_11135 [Chloroflexota bacterium]|nr:hypothetical protein [Chloroflexota bacterium]
MDQPDRTESNADGERGERPGRIVVPGGPAEQIPDEEAATAARDLGSASRSCLVIIAILLALVLFACVALVARSLIGG